MTFAIDLFFYGKVKRFARYFRNSILVGCGSNGLETVN